MAGWVAATGAVAALVLLGSLGTLASCSSESEFITISSDIPDIAFVVRLYETENPNRKISLLPFSDYSQLMQADLALLSSDAIENTPYPIESYLQENFTSPLLHVEDNTKNLTLISFSLPLILVLKETSPKRPPSPHMSLGELQKQSKESTQLRSKSLSTFGFVPDMNPDFAKLFSNRDSYASWIEDAFVEYETYNESYHRSFDSVPYLAQLRNENIVYKLVMSNEFFDFPRDVQDDFYYFFLSRDNASIPVVEASYAGKNKTSNKGRELRELLAWLYREETQLALLTMYQNHFPQKKLPRFLGNSFSSNWNTNEYIFKQDALIWNAQPLLSQLVFY